MSTAPRKKYPTSFNPKYILRRLTKAVQRLNVEFKVAQDAGINLDASISKNDNLTQLHNELHVKRVEETIL